MPNNANLWHSRSPRTISLNQLLELVRPQEPSVRQFSVKLSGRHLALFEFLKDRVAGFGITAVVHDGLALLGLLHSKDGAGRRPSIVVRFTDSDGRSQEKPLADFLYLQSLTTRPGPSKGAE